MSRRLKSATEKQITHVEHALRKVKMARGALKAARELLESGGANVSAEKVAALLDMVQSTLKSVEGAVRHVKRRYIASGHDFNR